MADEPCGRPTAREARKLEQVASRTAAEAERELSRKLKAALREPSPQRSDESSALIRAHPEATARLRVSIAKAEKAKKQQEANATEIEDDDATLQAKVDELAHLLQQAQHAVVYTGAGLSTAASIPDYRGPQGLWTLHNKKRPGAAQGAKNAPCAARAAMGQSFAETKPTAGHMALAALVCKGVIKQIISQNVDGLHSRSGLKPSMLCELHGNVFREQCPSCGKEYVRNFDVTARSAYRRHGTQRVCERKACARAELRDTIVYFGEKIASSDLSQAQEHSEKADLAIFIGSSLKVLQHYKFIWQQPPKPARKRFVIINLQPTPKDRAADVRIHGKCDNVLVRLLGRLKVQVPTYQPARDEVLRRAASPSLYARIKPEQEVAEAESAPWLDSKPEMVAASGVNEQAVIEDSLQCVGIGSDGYQGDDMLDKTGMDEVGRKSGMGERVAAVGSMTNAGELSAAAQCPPRKRRKRTGFTVKRKSLPRAFPAEPPPCVVGALTPSIEAHTSSDGLPAPCVPEDSWKHHNSSSTSKLEVESVPPDLLNAPAAPMYPMAAPAKKCAAKCGFFASSMSDDGLCSKCSARRTSEMEAWYGALSKKSAKTNR